MQINFGEFKSCVTDLPTKDGNYFIVGFFNGKCTHASVTEYTVEYGWNTHYSVIDGSPCVENKMNFSDYSSHKYLWCEPPMESGDNNDTQS